MGFNIGIKDIIDVLLVAILLYQGYKLLKKSGAVNLFIGILTFVIIWFLVSFVFDMQLLGGIMDRLMSVGAFGIVVLFQDEIRSFFSKLGSKQHWNFVHALKWLTTRKKTEQRSYDADIMQIVQACRGLSKTNMGALIVVKRNVDLDLYVQSGEVIDANINSRLIENIFFKNSPLHDGAMIIYGHGIKAAGCILPVSKNRNIPKHLGLRHRAALGVTETTDAIAIVVSEETGKISWAVNGNISVDVKLEQLEHFLSVALDGKE